MSEPLNLNRLIYFTTVVETGSFTAAAERLGVAKAVVSHQVARLEEELGASLLRRTTRRVSPTEGGRLFYDRTILVLRDAEAAFGEVAQGGREPMGTLRLTAPLDYGAIMVAPAIAIYLQRYPHMRVEAFFDDTVMNLVEERLGLAIRVGWLTDSSNTSRKLGRFQQVVAAKPELAATLGPGITPRDVGSWPWIANLQLRNITHWQFTKGDETIVTELNSVVTCDKTAAVRACVLSGIGFAILPDFTVAEDFRQGRLTQVLADWQLPESGIHAVFPPARYRPAKVKAFVDILTMLERART